MNNKEDVREFLDDLDQCLAETRITMNHMIDRIDKLGEMIKELRKKEETNSSSPEWEKDLKLLMK